MILLDIPYDIMEKILMENSRRANQVFRIGKGELILRKLAVNVMKIKTKDHPTMRNVAARFGIR